MTKKYGCYGPKGEMCVGFYGKSVRQKAIKAGMKKVDKYYAASMKDWYYNYDLSSDADYKRMVVSNSSISFCDKCCYEGMTKECREYRKTYKHRLIY